MGEKDRKGFDYLAFYDRFRSPPDIVKQHQAAFLKFFQGCRQVLDIGCGRGEFLDVLRQHGIPARGIDVDPDMVARCRDFGLDVEEADGISYLEEHDGFDGIYSDQVVEHLKPPYLIRLIELCYAKLMPGGHMIVKTINPLSLATFTDFYLDLSHTMAIHPEAMKYILKHAGFRYLETRYFGRVPEEERLKTLDTEAEICKADPAFAATYNHNVGRLNDLLFGGEDYAIVAQKKG